ncbi:MAG TPA: response regulator transcription factor [Acidobacteriota bacterium]|nr:response regulator transcription factor [Acidobacteriota bacterium]
MQQPHEVLILSRYQISGEAVRLYLSQVKILGRPKFLANFRRFDSPTDIASLDNGQPTLVILICRDETQVAVKSLRALFPFARILIVARDASQETQAEWINQGAGGVFDERDAHDLEQLERAVDFVIDGEVWASRRVLSLCVRRPEDKRQEDNPLTRREQELIGLLRLGLTNSSIAERLHISQKTVKGHLTNIYRKLEVDNRLQAVLKSRQLTAVE